MDAWQQFIICVAGVLLAVIVIKIFFTLWKSVEKKLHPESVKIGISPETAFKNLRKKNITIYMKNGEVLTGLKYIKTIFFNDGDFGLNAIVYFEVTQEDKRIFISGSDIIKIETNKN